MLVDTTVLMYNAFLLCRLGSPDAAVALEALSTILARIREAGALQIDDEFDGATAAIAPLRLEGIGDVRYESKPTVPLSASNQDLFQLIEAGAHDLRRLCNVGSQLAVRNLGYAFHVLPGLLASPEEFDRDSFLFNFRFVANHWDELSSDLHHAFATALKTDPERLERLVRKEGFASSQY